MIKELMALRDDINAEIEVLKANLEIGGSFLTSFEVLNEIKQMRDHTVQLQEHIIGLLAIEYGLTVRK
jgi:hypothetical protein